MLSTVGVINGDVLCLWITIDNSIDCEFSPLTTSLYQASNIPSLQRPRLRSWADETFCILFPPWVNWIWYDIEISCTEWFVSNFLINVSSETGNSIFVSVAFIFRWIIRANTTLIFAYLKPDPTRQAKA